MRIMFSEILNLYNLCVRAYGKYGLWIAVFIGLGFISGILEGIGINSAIPAFSFINGKSSETTDIVSRTVESIFNKFDLRYSLRNLLIFIVMLFVIKAVILFCANYMAAKINTTYERDTRASLLRSTLEAGWPYLSKQKVGYLDQILTTDVNYSSNLLSYLNGSIIILINLFIYTLVAVNISAMVAGLTLVLGLLIFLVFRPLFLQNKVLSKKVETFFKEVAHFINETIIGVKTVKSMSVEKSVMLRGLKYFDEVRVANFKAIMLRNITNVALQPIGLIFVLAIFAYFYKYESFSFVSFAVMVYVVNKIFSYIQVLQSQWHSINSFVPYLTSISTYYNSAINSKESLGDSKKFIFKYEFKFDKVDFSYDVSEKVLQQVSFSIKKGELVGLIGPSGAGKTTLVDLGLRLLRPSAGQILLDGVDIKDIAMSDWRNNIGYVSQDIFLINDTIANNIRFYDSTISDEAIMEAAKLAYIDEFVQGLPDKYSTVVGERGVRLSGGQKQRIVLARILVRQPEILILDEATSALDNESEIAIQKSIEGLHGKITVLAIAHRLSTIEFSDKLLVLEDGRIIEEGSPQELLKNPASYFSKVYNLSDRIK